MKLRNLFLIHILTVVAFLALPVLVVNAGVGISPAMLIHEKVKPGNTIVQELMISQSEPEVDIQVTIEPDMGEANSWFSFEPSNEFVITKGVKRYPMTVKINVPEGTVLGDFTGYLRLKTTPVGATADGGGVSVVQGARIDVSLSTTNEDFQELTVRAIDIADVLENGEVSLSLTLENSGNIATAPDRVTVDILDLNQQPLETIELTDIPTVNVGDKQEVTVKFSTKLPEGEYFADVKVYLRDILLREDQLSFRRLGAATAGAPSVSDTSDFFSRLFGENMGLTLLVVVLEAGAVLLTVHLMEKRLKKLKISKRRLYMAAIIVFAVLALVSVFILNYRSVAEPAKDTIQSTVSANGPVVATAAVLGASSGQPESKTTYAIYATPDTASQIVYRATDGESFETVEDAGAWLRVTLPDGGEGWIERGSLKQ